MAMDELVKRDVATRKSQLKARKDQNLKDIAAHQAAIDKLTAENTKIGSLVVAYEKDIPAPIVKPMEV